MKSVGKSLMLAAIVLLVLGVVSFPMETVVNPPPEPKCAAEGEPTSGFVDEESKCAITIDSWNEISQWNSSPKWFRITGLGLVLLGLIVGIVGLVLFLRGRGAKNLSGVEPATQGAAGNGPPSTPTEPTQN